MKGTKQMNIFRFPVFHNLQIFFVQIYIISNDSKTHTMYTSNVWAENTINYFQTLEMC